MVHHFLQGCKSTDSLSFADTLVDSEKAPVPKELLVTCDAVYEITDSDDGNSSKRRKTTSSSSTEKRELHSVAEDRIALTLGVAESSHDPSAKPATKHQLGKPTANIPRINAVACLEEAQSMLEDGLNGNEDWLRCQVQLALLECIVPLLISFKLLVMPHLLRLQI